MNIYQQLASNLADELAGTHQPSVYLIHEGESVFVVALFGHGEAHEALCQEYQDMVSARNAEVEEVRRAS